MRTLHDVSVVTVSAAQFAALKRGSHEFPFESPLGTTTPLRVIVWGLRRKASFTAQFDLISTAWKSGKYAQARFDEQYGDCLRESRRQHPGVPIFVDFGDAVVHVEAPQEERGEWLQRIAQFVSDRANLEPDLGSWPMDVDSEALPVQLTHIDAPEARQ